MFCVESSRQRQNIAVDVLSLSASVIILNSSIFLYIVTRQILERRETAKWLPRWQFTVHFNHYSNSDVVSTDSNRSISRRNESDFNLIYNKNRKSGWKHSERRCSWNRCKIWIKWSSFRFLD